MQSRAKSAKLSLPPIGVRAKYFGPAQKQFDFNGNTRGEPLLFACKSSSRAQARRRGEIQTHPPNIMLYFPLRLSASARVMHCLSRTFSHRNARNIKAARRRVSAERLGGGGNEACCEIIFKIFRIGHRFDRSMSFAMYCYF
jgi:hypothetical protein